MNWAWKKKTTATANPTAMLDLSALKRRLAAMPADDPLWPQLMALLDAYVLAEVKALASPALDDAEAHRLRGRAGMMLDFKNDLDELRRKAVQEAAENS